MEKEINAPLFAPWKEGKGHEKTEDAAIGRLPSAARPKGCPFPNSLITAKKHDPESYTLSPFGGKKKKSAKLKCFRKQNICLRVRKRFSEKVNKSKDPTIRTKNLKRSSYLWPSKYLNHAISLGTWLGTLHISRCLPEDLDRLPPHVTAPPPPHKRSDFEEKP